ncbi:hypothetical protein [Rickettsiella massiliensis]|uniref:hypothetical protein n=1 Tax=Rickettsiella massiliensis TaxID=676517 RepID=UPI00029B0592|nr:hypothetical protein [Rickettsiella massiliensis]
MEFFNEKEKVIDRYLLTSLLRLEYIYTLSREDKQELCEKIITDPKFIAHIEDLNTLLSIAPSFASRLDKANLVALSTQNNDLMQFIRVINRFAYIREHSILKKCLSQNWIVQLCI